MKNLVTNGDFSTPHTENKTVLTVACDKEPLHIKPIGYDEFEVTANGKTKMLSRAEVKELLKTRKGE